MVKKTWSLWRGVGKARLCGFCRTRVAGAYGSVLAFEFWLIRYGIQMRTRVASGDPSGLPVPGSWLAGGNLTYGQRKTCGDPAVTEASPRISRTVIATPITCGNHRFDRRCLACSTKNISGA